MILDETIKVRISSTNAKYYEKIGYDVPKKFSFGKKRFDIGSEIEIDVKDLPEKSNIIVTTKCDNCGKIDKRPYYSYIKFNGVCRSCSCSKRIGKNSANWKGGLSICKCIDCGKKIYGTNKKRKRCSECFEKNKIKNSVNYCVDCGKKISRYAKRCHVCASTGKLNGYYNNSLTDEERNARKKYERRLNNWKKKVLKKFNYTCQKCKIIGEKNSGLIECHHVYNFRDYSDLRSDIENGITLCKNCHNDFHKLYGKRYNNWEQMKEFINGKNT